MEIYLVGGFSSSVVAVGMMKFPIYGIIKIFRNANQICILDYYLLVQSPHMLMNMAMKKLTNMAISLNFMASIRCVTSFHIPKWCFFPHVFSAENSLGFHSEYCKVPTVPSTDPQLLEWRRSEGQDACRRCCPETMVV